MRYAKIKTYDIANGPGVRVSLFVQGCSKHCDGCFNPETWDYNGGISFTEDTKRYLFDACSPDYISGLSILGGEPFDQAIELAELVREFKELYPNKDVAVWSGYVIDEIESDPDRKQLLDEIDVLIDGPFIKELKEPNLTYMGSTNQRVIFVKERLQIPNKVKVKRRN